MKIGNQQVLEYKLIREYIEEVVNSITKKLPKTFNSAARQSVTGRPLALRPRLAVSLPFRLKFNLYNT